MRLVAGLALLVLLAPVATPEEVLADDWYALYIGDGKAGFMHSRIEKAGSGFVTISEVVMTIARMGSEVTLRFEDRTEEDASGRVVRFRRKQDLGAGPSVISGELEADGRIRGVASGRERYIEYPEGAIGPECLARRLRAAGLEEGTRTKATVFSIDFLGRTVIAEEIVGKRETVEYLGQRVPLHRTTTSLSVMPGFESISWVGADRRVYRIDHAVPLLGTMRMVLTVETLAKRPGEPAEMFTTTLIRPDRVIPEPRKGGRAVYRLHARSGRIGDVPVGHGHVG